MLQPFYDESSYALFPVKVTAVLPGTSPFTGSYVYSWTEQAFTSAGAPTDLDGGRTGTSTSCPGIEVNNVQVSSFPFYTWMRYRCDVGGAPVYEFEIRAPPPGTSIQPIGPASLAGLTGKYAAEQHVHPFTVLSWPLKIRSTGWLQWISDDEWASTTEIPAIQIFPDGSDAFILEFQGTASPTEAPPGRIWLPVAGSSPPAYIAEYGELVVGTPFSLWLGESTTNWYRLVFATELAAYLPLSAVSSFMLTVLDDTSGAAVRATIGAGTSSFSGAFTDLTGKPTTLGGYGITDGQPLDATLTALAALTIVANSITLGTGTDAFSQLALAANTFLARSSSGNVDAKTITDFAFSLLDDANAATALTTLGGTTVGQALFGLTNPSAITFLRLNADNSVTALSAADFRTALGGTTVGQALFGLTNPSAITFIRVNADNTVSALSAADFRTAIGAGTGSGSVTSVALTVPSIFSLTGSPVASAGTLAVTLATQSANKFFAGPGAGMAVVPTFRDMVVGDLPAFTGFSALGAGTYTSTLLLSYISGNGYLTMSEFLNRVDVVVLEDQRATNTAGGGFTSAARRTRVLNTEVEDNNSACSLSSNQFTLSAGTWWMFAIVPGHACNRHQAYLTDWSIGSDLLIGSSAFASQGNVQDSYSFIFGVFDQVGTHALEIQHECQTTQATNGFGVETNHGPYEVYTRVFCFRMK